MKSVCVTHPQAPRTSENRCSECRRVYCRQMQRRRRENDFDKKLRRQATEGAKRYREKNPHKYRQWKGLPEPTRPKPEFCELDGCDRPARCLDHDHVTGVFRGWLCNRHNLALGYFGDNADGLIAALQYLRGFE